MLLVMVRDLLFASKIDAASRRAGVSIAWAPRDRPLADGLREGAADAVLMDLGEPGAIDALRALRSERPGVRVTAFAGHLRTDLIDEARSLGAEVLTRGQLSAALVDVLARATGEPAAPG